MFDGEMAALLQENTTLKEELLTASQAKARWETGGLAGEMMEAESEEDNSPRELERLQTVNKVLTEPLCHA